MCVSQAVLQGILASRKADRADLALVALVGASETLGAPGEVRTLRGLRRALPGLSGRQLGRLGDRLVELGAWAAHPDGYVSLPGDVAPPPDDRLERRRAQWRAYKQRIRAPKVATPIATPPEPAEVEEPKQGHVDTSETTVSTRGPQQVLPGFDNGSAEGVHNVHGGRPPRHRARKPKAPKEKKPREKSPKDLRLEHISERYVAAYLARFGVEPGLPAWSLVQRVETWTRRNAPNIGKTFEEVIDLVLQGYFAEDWALDCECPFRPMSENPARFYRAAAGLSEPRRIRRRYIAPAPPCPPSAFEGESFEDNMAELARAADKLFEERAERAAQRKAERQAAKQPHMH